MGDDGCARRESSSNSVTSKGLLRWFPAEDGLSCSPHFAGTQECGLAGTWDACGNRDLVLDYCTVSATVPVSVSVPDLPVTVTV